MSENRPGNGYDPRVYGFGDYGLKPGTMPPPPVKKQHPHAWIVITAICCALALIISTVVGTYLGRSLAQKTEVQEKFFVLQKVQDESVQQIHQLQDSTYESIADIAEDVGKSVVAIRIHASYSNAFLSESQDSIGSAIIIGENTEKIFIATNFHVIENAASVHVIMGDRSEEITAFPQGVDTDTDLAVMYILKSDLEPSMIENMKIAVFGDSDQCRLGDLAIAIGSAYDIRFGNSVTVGTISGLERNITFVDENNVGQTMVFLQTDAAINPGNSGGALVNGRGEVIGINNYKIEDTQVEGMGFATPSNVAEPILEDLVNYGKVSRPFIGITGMDVINYENYAVEYDIPEGVIVLNLIEGGPAEQAGILPFDVITGMDGQPIHTFDDLSDIIMSKQIGDSLEIEVLRGYKEGEKTTVTMTLTVGEKDSTTRR
ncbi:MAG: trypsin-like peptidase domain-containing protein [Firmicutes bacterium]|nr:trypsin-like peptidase domain-containing protein [Bacillota bacterium]